MRLPCEECDRLHNTLTRHVWEIIPRVTRHIFHDMCVGVGIRLGIFHMQGLQWNLYKSHIGTLA